MQSRLLTLFIAKALLIAQIAFAADNTQTKVVCFGDSITKRGYPGELASQLNIEVIPAGISGQSSAEGLARIQEDVLDRKPSHVIVLFGTNDLRIDAPPKYQTIKQYTENLRTMIEKCQAAGARVILCTPPPIDDEAFFTRHERSDFDGSRGLAKRLKASRKAVKKLGREFRLPVVDLNHKLKKSPEWMHKDGVHPTTPAGNKRIATLVADKLRPLL